MTITVPSLFSAIATRVRGGYRIPLAERTRRITDGLAKRKASGRWTGRVPYGYRRPLVDLADGRRVLGDQLEADPETAPIVARIFADALIGATNGTIAAGLNRDGVPAWTTGQWSSWAVSRLLNNPTYLGRWGAPRLVDPGVAALLVWPRQRRPLDPTSDWGRYCASLSPKRQAEVRAIARDRARRWRDQANSHSTKED